MNRRNLLVAFLTVGTTVSAQQVAPPEIRVTGAATREIEPDQAELDLGVVTQAQTARSAAEINAGKVDTVLDALRAELGPDAKLETIRYVVRPNYDRQRGGGDPTITSYSASNVVRATALPIDAVGRLIDAATTAGANKVERLVFTVQDAETERLFALADAAKQARRKANAIAEALGLRITNVASVEEGASASPGQYQARAMMMQADEAVATPIEAGTLEIHASVTLRVRVVPR